MKQQVLRVDVERAIADLCEAYGKNPDFEHKRVPHYYDALRDLDVRFLRDAIRSIIKNATGYFPMPAVIREHATKAERTYVQSHPAASSPQTAGSLCDSCGTTEFYVRHFQRPQKQLRSDEIANGVKRAQLPTEEFSRVEPLHRPHCRVRPAPQEQLSASVPICAD